MHDCNLHKGSDISSLDPRSGELVPLFNPRKHAWSEHLELVGTEIVGLTAEGRATSTLLKLNSDERRLERQGLIELGRFDSRDE